MDANIVNQIAQTICDQLNCVPKNVCWSWGLHELRAEVIKPGEYEMAALSFLVSGFNFKGRIWIALNEGKDLYEIYGRKHGAKKMVLLHDDVFCEDFESILDPLIETGGPEGQAFYSQGQTVASVVQSVVSDPVEQAAIIDLFAAAWGA